MQHYAVFAFPDFGHVNPVLEVTRHLVERGHRVTYILDAKYQDLVEATGAAIVGYQPRRRRLGAGHSVDADQMGELGLDVLADALDTILPLAREAFADDVPDVVIYDYESFVAARTISRMWGRPTIQFFPYFASNETYSLHAEVFDPPSPAVLRSVDALVEALSSLEPDNPDVWALMVPNDLHNVVLVPREFQPAGDSFDERFAFVGHCVSDAALSAQWTRPDNDAPVVLISLGTESNERAGFFRTCAEAFEDQAWHVVMTLGRGNAEHDIPDAPNIEAHEWLAHTAVLPHAAVLVCHGGMGSILEALYFGRAVVVVPHTPEQVVNARRVVELGLGRVVASDELTAANLRQVVDELAQDPDVARRLLQMRASIIAAGGAARAADVIEGYSPSRLSPAAGTPPR